MTNILIPMDSNHEDDAKITDIFSAKYWAVVAMNNGKLENVAFYENYNELLNNADFIILKNGYEPIMKFMEHEIIPLVAPIQRSIEDIVEAYIFKELQDIA